MKNWNNFKMPTNLSLAKENFHKYLKHQLSVADHQQLMSVTNHLL